MGNQIRGIQSINLFMENFQQKKINFELINEHRVNKISFKK